MAKQSRGLKTKEKIERVSLALFVQKGIKETTIKDISAATELAEGTLYRHYKSKEELALSLFKENYLTFSAELEQAIAPYTDPNEQLMHLVAHFIQSYDQDPILFSYLLLSQHGMMDQLEPDCPHAVDLLTRLIEQGQQQGCFKNLDSDLLTALILGAVLQPAVSKTYGRLQQDLGAYQAEIQQAVKALILQKS